SQELQKYADVVVHMATTYEYAPTHVEDLVNAFRYTDAQAVEKIEHSAIESGNATRHTYAPLQNQSALGAQYIGTPSRSVEPQQGYQIDDIGVRPRSATIALTGLPQHKSTPLLS